MSLKASITRPAARIAKLQRPTATRAFDRKLISEEYDEAIIVRIPTKPATHSNRKPATDSDLKPAGIPI